MALSLDSPALSLAASAAAADPASDTYTEKNPLPPSYPISDAINCTSNDTSVD